MGTKPVLAFCLAVALLLGFVGERTTQVALQAPGQTPIAAGSGAPDTAGPGSNGKPQGSGSAQDPGTPIEVPPPQAGLKCLAGRNGGATDVGVTATSIDLPTTIVQSGAAASLLGDAYTAMRAVAENVNAQGGICGRALVLRKADDGFDARLGQQYLNNFIAEKAFALPVVPSSEGLSAAIRAGDIDRAGIPVVGTDGLRREQYDTPWVWPVATATVSTMRIMARYGAQKRGAKTFAIVWDSKYKFGVEGADAFKQEVRKLGGTLVADVQLDPDQGSYATEANLFSETCGNNKCDMVAMLLLPDTGKKWMSRKPAVGYRYTAGAQTLFTKDFAQGCVVVAGSLCRGMAIWTGFLPPLSNNAGLPDISAYVKDIKLLDPSIDELNQFTEGAYLGMKVLVEALRKVGPDLTRARLRAVLDQMTFRSDFTVPLKWRPGNHAANTSARAYSIAESGGQFTGWSDENTGWRTDPIGP